MDTFLPRRFSFGGYPSELVAVAGWKFDVLLCNGSGRPVTCYVGCAVRGDALEAFFASHPRARIFGTGLPLTEAQTMGDLGRPLTEGEVLLSEDIDGAA